MRDAPTFGRASSVPPPATGARRAEPCQPVRKYRHARVISTVRGSGRTRPARPPPGSGRSRGAGDRTPGADLPARGPGPRRPPLLGLDVALPDHLGPLRALGADRLRRLARAWCGWRSRPARAGPPSPPGRPRMAFSAPLSLATIGAGVPGRREQAEHRADLEARAARPAPRSARRAASPPAARWWWRARAALPDLMCGCAAGAVSIIACTCPPMRSVIAGPLPL